jgi:hypothetical protein
MEIQVTVTDANRYRPVALVFAASLGLALFLPIFGPRLLASHGPVGAASYNPPWLVFTALGFGLIAVCTVPFALALVLPQAHLAYCWCCRGLAVSSPPGS